MFHDTVGYRARANPDEQEFATELDARRWHLAQRKLDDRDRAAVAEHPPGKRLFVQTKTVPSRRRMGIDFSNKGRVVVEVVDASDEEVAEAVTNGKAVVTPLGAKAIMADDGLVVYEQPAEATEARVADLEAELAAAKAKLADSQAELASMRSKRTDPDAVKPERLAKPAAPAKPPTTAEQAVADAAAADTKLDTPKK